MTFSMVFVLLVIIAAIAMFAIEKIPVDLTALIIMAVLLLGGIITPEQGLQGLSNTATVTIAAMFVLSAGLFKTGGLNGISIALSRVGKTNFWLAFFLITLGIGVISAFVNNTAAVAIFLPITMKICRSINISPSKLLMPLSFASIFGGVCTLIGTSTNLLVSSIAERHGLPAFSMFEFTGLGLIVFAIGLVYLAVIGIWLIPKRRSTGDLSENYGLGNYITEVVISPEAKLDGKQLREWSLLRDLEIDVLQVLREGKSLGLPKGTTLLHTGDVLRISGRADRIKHMDQSSHVFIKPGSKWRKQNTESETALVEAIIAPHSRLEGKSVRECRLRENRHATVLAIRHRGELVQERFKTVPLQAGDALLIEMPNQELDAFKNDSSFILVSQVNLPFRKNKFIPALAIVVAVVAAAAFNWLPIVVSAIAGCVAMILFGCLTLEEAYQAIEWKVIFLLAGVLTLGVALENTGGATLFAQTLQQCAGLWGPMGLLTIIVIVTMLVTNIISNVATVALIAPIAIALAESQGLQTRPFLIAVTFCASLSFMTPIGYQTNTMIYGPGNYRFTDFLRVGVLLNVLLGALLVWLIPQIWPFN